MARSTKMMAAALLVLAVAAATAEARNIKTADKKQAVDAAVQPQTFPPFDRLGGGMPGGSSSLPGSSMPFPFPSSGGLTPGFGSMPGFGGFGGLPGSPAAVGSVPEHATKP